MLSLSFEYSSTRSGAAPEIVEVAVEVLARTVQRQREVILRVTRARLNGAQTVVEQTALVVIEIARLPGPAIEVACQLQHVVRATAFGGIRAGLRSIAHVGIAQFPSQLPRLALPSFGVAGAFGNVTARAHHFIPEKVGHIMEAHIAGDLVPARRRDHLRNVRIHVEPAQLVAPQRQRIEEALLGIPVACFGPLVIAGFGRQIVEHLAHTAVLGAQDVLHVLFGLRRGPPVGPIGHAGDYFERLLVAGILVHVEHSGHDLVDGVERRPYRPACVEAIEKLQRKRAQIAARAELRLALGERVHHFVAFGLGLLVAGGRPQLRAGRQKMTGEMAA